MQYVYLCAVYVVFQPQKGCGQWAGLTSEGSRVRGHRMAPPSSSCGHTPCTSPVATHTIAYGEGTRTYREGEERDTVVLVTVIYPAELI